MAPRRETLYQITIYDHCCSPIADGTTCFYTADIAQFKADFLELCDDDLRKERFLRSLSGEIVTDYYSDDPKLNIVQSDEAEIYGERVYTYGKTQFTLENIYGYTSEVQAERAEIRVMSIRFRDRYCLVGSYHLYGAYVEEMWSGEQEYMPVNVYGNPIIRNICPAAYICRESHDAPPDSRNRDVTRYRENELYTVCYVPFCFTDAHAELPETLSEEDIRMLMCDIPGEAG